MRMRASKGAGAVRFGVLGNLSATNSPIARSENIAAANVDPIKARGEVCRFNHPRWAAQLTTAGAISERKPETTPIPTANAKRQCRLIMMDEADAWRLSQV